MQDEVPEFLRLEGIDKTLADRGKTYGAFKEQARLTQTLKTVMRTGDNWNGDLADDMRDDMREALDMIASKIARILNGDPTHKDSWHDIIGYAKLIEDTLE